MTDDAILIEQTLAGDPSAFERLVHRYKGAAFALALQYVQNFHDAQDIVQEMSNEKSISISSRVMIP